MSTEEAEIWGLAKRVCSRDELKALRKREDLYRLGEFSWQALGERLGVTARTAKSRVLRAESKIGKSLAREKGQQVEPQRWVPVMAKGGHPSSVRARAKAGFGVDDGGESEPMPWVVGAYLRAKGMGAQAEFVQRGEIIERDGMVCYLCDEAVEVDDLELDHIVPLHLGGSHVPSNLGVTHAACNRSKGRRLTDKRPAALRASLRHREA